MSAEVTRVPPLPPIGVCVLVAWHVEQGAKVSAGDLLAEIESHKAVLEWRAPLDCVVEEILVSPGTALEEGRPLARLDTGADPVVFAYREWKR